MGEPSTVADGRTGDVDAWATAPLDLASRPPRPAHGLRSLAGVAAPLAGFRPPFAFGDFYAPEDTLLCALATEFALSRVAADGSPRRLIELTCGSAVVALEPLTRWPALRAWGADVDETAVARARDNAAALGVADRARFAHLGLFDPRLPRWLRRRAPDVVACNPPYVPEPPGTPGALVAGAGPDGARHPRHAIAACARAGVPRLVLSWCSLGDPVGVARSAARRGYVLEALWAAALADGEYTGGAHDYLRTLPTAWLNESSAMRAALAPDGAARFGYLLLAGSFVRAPGSPAEAARTLRDPDSAFAGRARMGVRLVARLVRRFTRDGLPGLRTLAGRTGTAAPGDDAFPPLHPYLVDRWDELALRMLPHGPADPPAP